MANNFKSSDIRALDFMRIDFRFDITNHFLQRCRERHISASVVKELLVHGLSQIINDATINGRLNKAEDCKIITILQNEDGKYIVIRVYKNAVGKIVVKLITAVRTNRDKRDRYNDDGSETVVHKINTNEYNINI